MVWTGSICSVQIRAINFISVVLVRLVTKYFCTEKGGCAKHYDSDISEVIFT